MTTTPDSRIRADWTLPAETAAPVPSLEAIDTATTAGKVAVMQAFVRGERIEMNDFAHRGTWDELRTSDGEPDWRWNSLDYRIATPVPTRTALSEARERVSEGGDLETIVGRKSLLQRVVEEIDSCKTVDIAWKGEGHYHFQHNGITPGRYRLVRDEA